MRKLLVVFVGLGILTVSACSAPAATPAPLPTRAPIIATPAPAAVVSTATPTETPLASAQAPGGKGYKNDEFGFKFQFPSDWFGPDEYVSDQMLRLQVGSDKVYPYGTDPTEQIYTRSNSYYVLIQYSKNDQNTNWKDTYESLIALQDGETVSTARSLTIKVRNFELGRFKGLEYISTLSETAQTEHFYARNVILFDDQANVVTVMGQPNNVETDEDMGWREAYEMVDSENAALFHEIVESITVE